MSIKFSDLPELIIMLSDGFLVFAGEYTRKIRPRSPFGHASNIMEALNFRKELENRLKSLADGLSEADIKIARQRALLKIRTYTYDDQEHSTALIETAFSIVNPANKSNPAPSLPTSTKTDKISLTTPTAIFAATKLLDPRKYERMLKNGTTYNWQCPTTGEIILFTAHPYKNGKDGFLDPDTYCP